jgi:hypothetical protein
MGSNVLLKEGTFVIKEKNRTAIEIKKVKIYVGNISTL